MFKILSQKFYNRPTLKVAQELLGKFLVYKTKKGKLSGKIVETEAYIGQDDLASHASKGLTPRTALMYGQSGYWYIYLIYGFYCCLNVVTESKDYPAAVLIRAVEPVEGADIMKKNRKISTDKPFKLEKLANGPGKLCQAFGIDKDLNGTRAFAGNHCLLIEDRGEEVKKTDMVAAKRVGVDYAGEWKEKEWRFYLKNSPYISKK